MKEGFKNLGFYLCFPIVLEILFYKVFVNNIAISNFIVYLLLIIMFIIKSFKDLKSDFFNIKNNWKRYLLKTMLWTLAGFCLVIISNYIISKFITTLPNNEIQNRNFIHSSPFIALTYLLILAPITEEYVFRYSFKSINNYYLYIFITSFLFAGLHLLAAQSLNELIYFIPYFFLGFTFGNIYFKSKNYFCSLVSHIIYNLVCVIIILMQVIL